MDYGPPHSNHPKQNSDASKQNRVRIKIHHKFPENQDSSDTLSLSSSNSSSSDEFFEVNPHVLPNFRDHDKPPHSNRGSKLEVYENEETEVFSDSMSSDITHESLVLQFPPLQIMEKNREFDPNRIPDSIFSKCSTPTEWSADSNDSLFTLRVGESGFSRDLISMTDINMTKADELLNSRELESPKASGELIRFGHTDPTFKRTEPYFDVENDIIARDVKPKKTQIVAEPINGCLKKDLIIGVSRNSYERNHHYDQSEICVNPFAKPIGEKSSLCPLCHCHNCCRELFCCKCLTCSCKWLWWPTFSSQWCVWPCSKICSSCCCRCPNFSSLCCNFTYWSCCKCSSWPSCMCGCSSCACCCCWKREPTFTCSSPIMYASSLSSTMV